MKLFSKRTYFILFSSVAISLTSCTPEGEEPTPTDDRDKFVGAWTCAETSALNGKSTFTIDIKISSTDKSQVLIENFYNYGFNKSAYATVSGNTLTIPTQTFSGTNTLSGSGTLSSDGKKIESMSYTVNDGSADDACTAVLTKQ